MNKNIKTAKEIIKVAKQLIAGDFDQSITAGDFDNEVKIGGISGAFDRGINAEEIVNSIVSQAIENICKLVDDKLSMKQSANYETKNEDYGLILNVSFYTKDSKGYTFDLFTYFGYYTGYRMDTNIYNDHSKISIRNVAYISDCKEAIKNWLKNIQPKMIQILIKKMKEGNILE